MFIRVGNYRINPRYISAIFEENDFINGKPTSTLHISMVGATGINGNFIRLYGADIETFNKALAQVDPIEPPDLAAIGGARKFEADRS